MAFLYEQQQEIDNSLELRVLASKSGTIVNLNASVESRFDS
jgi:hypothetical protein